MVVMPDPKSYKKEYDSSYNFHPMISEDIQYVLKCCCFFFHILLNIGLVFEILDYHFLKYGYFVIIRMVICFCIHFVIFNYLFRNQEFYLQKGKIRGAY